MKLLFERAHGDNYIYLVKCAYSSCVLVFILSLYFATITKRNSSMQLYAKKGKEGKGAFGDITLFPSSLSE